MERIAIPIFQKRVSPVLDACNRLLIIDLEDGGVVNLQEIPIENLSFKERLDMFVQFKIKKIICGGVSELMLTMLKSKQIELIGGIMGKVDEIIAAYCCGSLDDPCFCMPGKRVDVK
jgi:predicted Fe-Mo cluster-binding NifX family protein